MFKSYLISQISQYYPSTTFLNIKVRRYFIKDLDYLKTNIFIK